MTYIYYIYGEKFTTDDSYKIPFDKISSPNEETPAIEYLKTSEKLWCEKGDVWHRLTGPALIGPDGTGSYWLYDIKYHNIHDWLKDHPNPDLYFDAIGIKTETEKILWFLQN
jgi:hypothetical protein